MATHHTALTSTQTSSPSSEVVTTRQTDGTAHKLKLRSFHKSAHLRVHSVDFHLSVNHVWHLCYSSNPHAAIVIMDASIKNDIATSISHIHLANCPLIKTVHHASFVTSMEAELFAIRCGINQACSIGNIFKIVVVTDSIHMAKKIFDYGSHSFQIHSAVILSKLQSFFSSNNSNSIKFWECPSKLRWRFHHDVDRDTKSFLATPLYPTKLS